MFFVRLVSSLLASLPVVRADHRGLPPYIFEEFPCYHRCRVYHTESKFTTASFPSKKFTSPTIPKHNFIRHGRSNLRRFHNNRITQPSNKSTRNPSARARYKRRQKALRPRYRIQSQHVQILAGSLVGPGSTIRRYIIIRGALGSARLG